MPDIDKEEAKYKRLADEALKLRKQMDAQLESPTETKKAADMRTSGEGMKRQLEAQFAAPSRGVALPESPRDVQLRQMGEGMMRQQDAQFAPRQAVPVAPMPVHPVQQQLNAQFAAQSPLQPALDRAQPTYADLAMAHPTGAEGYYDENGNYIRPTLGRMAFR